MRKWANLSLFVNKISKNLDKIKKFRSTKIIVLALGVNLDPLLSSNAQHVGLKTITIQVPQCACFAVFRLRGSVSISIDILDRPRTHLIFDASADTGTDTDADADADALCE